MSTDKELVYQIANQIGECANIELVIADGYYVQKLLDIISKIEDEPGIAEAMVSDESCVGDFFQCWWNHDAEQMRQKLAALKLHLGVEVKFEDLLIHVANKLKN